MATVSMTGKEYEELLEKSRRYNSLLSYLRKERQVTFTSDNVMTYSSGEFPNSLTFPEWLQNMLIGDMVEQLLNMDSEEFGLWATTEHHFYDVKDRDFSGWIAPSRVDLLEISPELRRRWEQAKEDVRKEIEEDSQDGE